MLKTALWLEFTTPDAAKKGIKYWYQLASEYPEHLNIVQLRNGRFHYSSSQKSRIIFY